MDLEEQMAKRSEAIESYIDDNLVKHQKWNQGMIDQTWRPITPPLEQPMSKSGFRPVLVTFQLPSPPASVSENEGAGQAMDIDQMSKPLEPRRSTRIRYGTPPEDVPYVEQTRFRRRTGRGGRQMVDRRGVKRRKLEAVDPLVADRYAFAGDSSDEDEQVYPVNPNDDLHMRYRIMIERTDDRKNAQLAAQQSRRAVENQNRSSSGHLLPPQASG